jgi:hypothetical protein
VEVHEQPELKCDVHGLKIRHIELEIAKLKHLREVEVLEAKLGETEADIEIEEASKHHHIADRFVQNIDSPAQTGQENRRSKEGCETMEDSGLLADTLHQNQLQVQAERRCLQALEEHMLRKEGVKFAAFQVAKWQQKLTQMEAEFGEGEQAEDIQQSLKSTELTQSPKRLRSTTGADSDISCATQPLGSLVHKMVQVQSQSVWASQERTNDSCGILPTAGHLSSRSMSVPPLRMQEISRSHPSPSPTDSQIPGERKLVAYLQHRLPKVQTRPTKHGLPKAWSSGCSPSTKPGPGILWSSTGGLPSPSLEEIPSQSNFHTQIGASDIQTLGHTIVMSSAQSSEHTIKIDSSAADVQGFHPPAELNPARVIACKSAGMFDSSHDLSAPSPSYASPHRSMFDSSHDLSARTVSMPAPTAGNRDLCMDSSGKPHFMPAAPARLIAGARASQIPGLAVVPGSLSPPSELNTASTRVCGLGRTINTSQYITVCTHNPP